MTKRTIHPTKTRRQANRFRLGNDAIAPGAFDLPLPGNALNIEGKSRSNLFPWRGQFSPQLVEALLRAYAIPGSVILDPFMGSGTVLIESARLGFPVYGYEVNPAAFLLARIYELCTLSAADRRDLLDEAEVILNTERPAAFDLPLFRVDADSALPPANGSNWFRGSSNARVRNLLEALIVLLNGDGAGNTEFIKSWSTMRRIVTSLPFTRNPVFASLGDARSLKLPDGAIDFVLSSPPYINVFNYHHNSRAGIESLGWRPLVVARSEIGSNRKFRQNRFLTVIQYCIDMALALAELRRVCNNASRVILILGRESNVHKTAFYNGEIVETLATEVVGFRMRLKQERVFINRFGQNIYEDILHLSYPSDVCTTTEFIVEQARGIGQDVLEGAVERTPDERKHYLEDAMLRAAQIGPSPILAPDAVTGEAL